MALIIVVLSAVLLFYRINRYPISLSIYEGLNGLTALKLNEGDRQTIERIWEKPIRNQAGCSAGIASADNNIFFIYPTTLFVKLLGSHCGYLSLRITSIIYGILSVWFIYLVAHRLFNHAVGLISAFLLATSSWALAYCRISLDLSATGFFILFCLYLFLIIDRPDNPIGYVILGFIIGLATYFYIPSRTVFPIIVLAMILNMVIKRGYFKSHYQYFLLLLAGFYLSLIIQGGGLKTYFITNVPSSFGFWSKSQRMGALLMRNIISIFNKLFFSWGWNDSIIAERRGSFDLISGCSFFIGLVWALWNIKKSQYRLMIIWVFSLLLPMILTTGEARRAILAAIPIYIIAAIGIYNVVNFITYKLKLGRTAIMVILILAIILPAGYLNVDNYFGLYEKAYRDENNKFVKARNMRNELIGLMKKSKVYTDLWRAEYGWPQSVEYDARRIGYGMDRYRLLSAEEARKEFEKSSPPAALYLKNGEIEAK